MVVVQESLVLESPAKSTQAANCPTAGLWPCIWVAADDSTSLFRRCTYQALWRALIPQAAILPNIMPPSAKVRFRNAPAARPRELPSAPLRLEPAPLVLGRWRLLSRVAASENAELYLARPIDRPPDAPADYLVKVARGGERGQLARALLRRELAVAASAGHANVAAVLDASFSQSPEHLVLANIGAPPDETVRHSLRAALWRARQIAAALAALHAAGWIHSRLTPRAMFVSPLGHATLSELGWSRRMGTDECRGEQLLAADLRYVAPEMLCDGVQLSPACDVYTLGLLLIEMLIGRPAVNAGVGWQAALAHLRGELADVRDFRVDVPPAVFELIARMTSREPLRRPESREVERQLVRLEVSQLSGGWPSRTKWQ